MRRTILAAGLCAGLITAAAAQEPAVTVEPPHLEGPRQLEQRTATSVVQDYIESWQSLREALNSNRVGALDRDFIGDAKTKLTETIQQQEKTGIHTKYQDRSHDVQIVFYSPEGLSIQLTDKVEYDVQVYTQDKLQTTQHVTAKYVVVMTPTEVRWRVRVFQAVAE